MPASLSPPPLQSFFFISYHLSAPVCCWGEKIFLVENKLEPSSYLSLSLSLSPCPPADPIPTREGGDFGLLIALQGSTFSFICQPSHVKEKFVEVVV